MSQTQMGMGGPIGAAIGGIAGAIDWDRSWSSQIVLSQAESLITLAERAAFRR